MNINSYVIFTDGACLGNPGPIGIGCAIYNKNNIIETISKEKGHGTNNEAEYLAVIEALTCISKYNPDLVSIFSDSQLVVNQINGDFKCNSPKMQTMLYHVSMLIEELQPAKIEFNWISREKNEVADNLASTAIGQNQGLIIGNDFIGWNKSSIKVCIEKIDSLPKTNLKCEKSIEQFNIGRNMKFGDFIKLKTYGMDAYSCLYDKDLLECIQVRFGDETVDWLNSSLENTDINFKRDALRWSARGLHPDLSLKKASVNAEMKSKYGNN